MIVLQKHVAKTKKGGLSASGKAACEHALNEASKRAGGTTPPFSAKTAQRFKSDWKNIRLKYGVGASDCPADPIDATMNHHAELQIAILPEFAYDPNGEQVLTAFDCSAAKAP